MHLPLVAELFPGVAAIVIAAIGWIALHRAKRKATSSKRD